MRRILIGIVVGAFVAFACIYAIEYAAATRWPLPAGVDPSTAAGASNMVAHMRPAAKILFVVAWCVGTLAGGAIAARMAHRRMAAWVVAAFVVTSALTTLTHAAEPGWAIAAAALLLPWLCAWAVQGAARFRRAH